MSKKISEFRMPAEWEPQKSVWMSWPHNKNDWPGLFEKIPNVAVSYTHLRAHET